MSILETPVCYLCLNVNVFTPAFSSRSFSIVVDQNVTQKECSEPDCLTIVKRFLFDSETKFEIFNNRGWMDYESIAHEAVGRMGYSNL